MNDSSGPDKLVQVTKQKKAAESKEDIGKKLVALKDKHTSDIAKVKNDGGAQLRATFEEMKKDIEGFTKIFEPKAKNSQKLTQDSASNPSIIREQKAGFAQLYEQAETQKMLDQFDKAQKLEMLKALQEPLNEKQKLQLQQVDMIRLVLDSMKTNIRDARTKKEWLKQAFTEGDEETNRQVQRLEQISLSLTTVPEQIKKNPNFKLVSVLGRAESIFDMEGLSSILREATSQEDIKKKYIQVLGFLRDNKDYTSAQTLTEDLLLGKEFQEHRDIFPEEKKREIREFAREKVHKKITKDVRDQWRKSGMSEAQMEQMEKAMTEEDMQRSMNRFIAEYNNGIPFTQLKGRDMEIMMVYKDMIGTGEWHNLSDATWDTVMDEILINAPLIIVSGGVANAARAGLSAGARAVIATGRFARLGLAAAEGARAIATTGRLGKSLYQAGRLGGLLAEGATFETVHAGLQGEWVGHQPDWVKKILWSSATLGTFHGAGEISEKVLSKMTKYAEKSLAQGIQKLAVSGAVETATMLAIGVIQKATETGELSGPELDEVLHALLSVGALKISGKGIEVAGKIFTTKAKISQTEIPKPLETRLQPTHEASQPKSAEPVKLESVKPAEPVKPIETLTPEESAHLASMENMHSNDPVKIQVLKNILAEYRQKIGHIGEDFPQYLNIMFEKFGNDFGKIEDLSRIFIDMEVAYKHEFSMGMSLLLRLLKGLDQRDFEKFKEVGNSIIGIRGNRDLVIALSSAKNIINGSTATFLELKDMFTDIQRKFGNNSGHILNNIPRGNISIETFREMVSIMSDLSHKYGFKGRSVLDAFRDMEDFYGQNLDRFKEVAETLNLLIKNLHIGSERLDFMLDRHRLESIMAIPKEKRLVYIEVMKLISEAPSQDIQRVGNELMAAITDGADPLGDYQKIEQIFIRNNLPLVGKIFKIFEILHPDAKIESSLKSKPALSPYLQEASSKRRKLTIFSDLLRIHIRSGNQSLREYLQVMKDGENLFDIIERSSSMTLSTDQLARLRHFASKLNTLYVNSQLGSESDGYKMGSDMSVEDIRHTYTQLRESLGVTPGQTMNQRVVELFGGRLGYQSIDQILAAMDQAKQSANERGLAIVSGAKNGQLALNQGDMIKGTHLQYVEFILQNGSVAKEYLGSSADSDTTPYDTDVAMIMEAHGDFTSTIDASVAKKYGEVLFVIKDRGQFEKSSQGTGKSVDPNKLELFKTGDHGESHYGIRTGFASTEIDYIIYTEHDQIPKKLFLQIAQNGFYIPVVDGNGKIIFTPEVYRSYRNIYNGLAKFGGDPLEFTPTRADDPHYGDISKIRSGLKYGAEEVKSQSGHIRSTIDAVLQGMGIELKGAHDTSILGAELHDTGSTGRYTNMSENFDFDLALRIDIADEAKIPAIVQALHEKFSPSKDESHAGNTPSDLYQLRFMGAKGFGDKPVDIDIAFVKKSELSVYGSHDAVRDRLDWVREHLGEASYEDVVSNIIMAKKVLKDGDAYKKKEDGGMGGIGVENWILANGGNLHQAAESFWNAAHDGSTQISLETFKSRYSVIDPGVNVKFLAQDNYVSMLNENGYAKTLKVLQKYLQI